MQIDITRELLINVGQSNPQLACALMEFPMLTPDSYEVRAEFTTGTDGTPLEAAFSRRTLADVWVQRVTYTVQRPAYQQGSPLLAWSDDFNTRHPYVDVYGKIDAENTEDFTQGEVPIETIFAPVGSNYPDGMLHYRGLVIPRNGSPWMRLTLRRALAVDEVPYIVRIVFLVLSLRGCRYGGISRLEAIAQLKAAGLTPALPTARDICKGNPCGG